MAQKATEILPTEDLRPQTDAERIAREEAEVAEVMRKAAEAAALQAAYDAEQAKAAKRIDFAKPVAVIVDQTDSRTNIRHFQADTVAATLALAHESAAEVTARTGRPCAVLGPQVAVKTPIARVEDAVLKLE